MRVKKIIEEIHILFMTIQIIPGGEKTLKILFLLSNKSIYLFFTFVRENLECGCY